MSSCMNKQKIIEQIISILNKVDDEKELKDMLALIRLHYNIYKLERG